MCKFQKKTKKGLVLSSRTDGIYRHMQSTLKQRLQFSFLFSAFTYYINYWTASGFVSSSLPYRHSRLSDYIVGWDLTYDPLSSPLLLHFLSFGRGWGDKKLIKTNREEGREGGRGGWFIIIHRHHHQPFDAFRFRGGIQFWFIDNQLCHFSYYCLFCSYVLVCMYKVNIHKWRESQVWQVTKPVSSSGVSFRAGLKNLFCPAFRKISEIQEIRLIQSPPFHFIYYSITSSEAQKINCRVYSTQYSTCQPKTELACWLSPILFSLTNNNVFPI